MAFLVAVDMGARAGEFGAETGYLPRRTPIHLRRLRGEELGLYRCGGAFNGILRRFSRDVDWP